MKIFFRRWTCERKIDFFVEYFLWSFWFRRIYIKCKNCRTSRNLQRMTVLVGLFINLDYSLSYDLKFLEEEKKNKGFFGFSFLTRMIKKLQREKKTCFSFLFSRSGCLIQLDFPPLFRSCQMRFFPFFFVQDV